MNEDQTKPLNQDDKLTLILSEIQEVKARLSGVEGRLLSLEERHTQLEEKVDRQLVETRPIWEAVLARLDTLEQEVKAGFHNLNRRVGILSDDINQLRADSLGHEKRLAELERQAS